MTIYPSLHIKISISDRLDKPIILSYSLIALPVLVTPKKRRLVPPKEDAL